MILIIDKGNKAKPDNFPSLLHGYNYNFCVVGKQQRCPYDGDFKCKTSGRCFRPWYVCDGYTHCKDGSDEQSCGM